MINDSNELIANFMGGVSGPPFYTLDTWDIPGMPGYQHVLHYDSSWDWLMPVLDKMHKDFNVSYLLAPCSGKRFYCHLESERHDTFKYCKSTEADTLLEATYNSIIEFINWWNENVRSNNIKK